MNQQCESKGNAVTAAFDGSDNVITLSSSDDDLNLEIAEKAKRERSEDVLEDSSRLPVIVLSSDEAEVEPARSAAANGGGGSEAQLEGGVKKKKRMKKKRGKPKKKNVGERGSLQVEGAVKEEVPLINVDSVVKEVNDSRKEENSKVNAASDNMVFRKLLRGPRYFNPGDTILETCYNCGEEGHTAANCTLEKRKKPCFFCGMVGHNAKYCTQGHDCFICKRRGHLAKSCPDKHKQIAVDSKVCLRCGESGHEMLSCKNDYSLEDLKEIQCYICNKYGHLCCFESFDFILTRQREVSCYNCAQVGHVGLGCAKQRGETTVISKSTLCYKCGEEGHFARGCTKNTKSSRWNGEPSSTPAKRFSNNASPRFDSAPHGFNKRQKKESMQHEESRWNGEPSSTPAMRFSNIGEPSSTPAKRFSNNASPRFDSAPHGFNKRQKKESMQHEESRWNGEPSSTPAKRFSNNASPWFNSAPNGFSKRQNNDSMRHEESRWNGEPSSTPTKRFSNNASPWFNSAPHGFSKRQNNESMRHEERRHCTPVNSRVNGSWMVGDPGDMPNMKHNGNGWDCTPVNSRVNGGRMVGDPGDRPNMKHNGNGWVYPTTPVRRFHQVQPLASAGQSSSSQSPCQRYNPLMGTPTPNSHVSFGTHYRGYPDPTFSNYQSRPRSPWKPWSN